MVRFELPVLALLAQAAYGAETECSNWSELYQKDLDGVCVCTEEKCDTVSNEYKKLKSGQVGVFRTTKAGDRLTYSVVDVDEEPVESPDFTIDVSTKYQEILGFGGAFTDAAAMNVYNLSSALQTKFFDSYFAEDGLEYSMARVPIASTDFSTSIYSYNDVAGDLEMENFSIDVDKEPNSRKLTMIKEALKLRSDLRMFASSWAPPAWMTTENSTLNCDIIGEPGEEYWEALALYYSKFFTEYAKEGVNFWGMTVQNEPEKQPLQSNQWQSLRLSPETERDFIKKDLGPRMKKDHPDLKIIAHDDQKSSLMSRDAMFKDEEASAFISGVAVHWYFDLDFFFAGLGGDFGKLEKFHKEYPDKFILATEACEGYLPNIIGTGAGVKIEDTEKLWYRAQNYARDMIQDLANYAGGWMDWNLALSAGSGANDDDGYEAGGPNWAKNYVDAPILVDDRTGKEFMKQPIYYVMGQFAKFLQPGTVRVEIKKLSGLISFINVDYTAFVTPENRVIVIFSNRRNTDFTVKLEQPNKQTVTVHLPAKAIQTLVLPSSVLN